MKILFICTSYNSLSQRLFLALEKDHEVTIEYALSEELMISATKIFEPELVLCPFLTTKIPPEVYERYMTLIIHPGPPGDAGPSSLDWLLLGDEGHYPTSEAALKALDRNPSSGGRKFWGVSIIQAIERFDAGPIWAFEQFPVDIDSLGLTKSGLYRGPVTRAAIQATLSAITRLQDSTYCVESADPFTPPHTPMECELNLDNIGVPSPLLKAKIQYSLFCIGAHKPFLGGPTYKRPLLKASQREFDVHRHTAQAISRRIRCADSQPGVLSKVFGPSLYIYGGMIDDSVSAASSGLHPGNIFAIRNEAVCIATCDGRGVWITHVRRVKKKTDAALWPKVPAILGLLEVAVLKPEAVDRLRRVGPPLFDPYKTNTFKEIWIDLQTSQQIAYLHFDYYNGAMTSTQCARLLVALASIGDLSHTRIKALVLMGGLYFSNGIALNVIEASSSPTTEAWANINAIDDVVHMLLYELPQRGIMTIAALRGNAAAGGVGLATACDIVLAGEEVVLNPAYRAMGLHGSEYHSLTYPARCGEKVAQIILKDMLPIDAMSAKSIGLVDTVLEGTGLELDRQICSHVERLMKSSQPVSATKWKKNQDLSLTGLAKVRAHELGEMARDFWSARSARFTQRRYNFVRKIQPSATPLRFATHRRLDDTCLDEEERPSWDDVAYWEGEQALTMAHCAASASRKLSLMVMLNSVDEKRQVQDAGRILLMPLSKGDEDGIKNAGVSCYYAEVPAEFEKPVQQLVLRGRVGDSEGWQ